MHNVGPLRYAASPSGIIHSWTRLIRTRLFRIPRYFELKTIPPGCSLQSFTIGFFELPLFRTSFRFPCGFGIGGVQPYSRVNISQEPVTTSLQPILSLDVGVFLQTSLFLGFFSPWKRSVLVYIHEHKLIKRKMAASGGHVDLIFSWNYEVYACYWSLRFLWGSEFVVNSNLKYMGLWKGRGRNNWGGCTFVMMSSCSQGTQSAGADVH